MKRTHSILSLALVAGLAAQANATVISDSGCCNEKSLQQILDDITVNGDSSVDVHNDQVSPDQYWQIGGSGGAVSTFIMEITAGDDTQTFGIYDKANPNNYINLFSGTDTSGDQVKVSSYQNPGSVFFNVTKEAPILDSNGNVVGTTTTQVDSGSFGTNNFGFFLGYSNGPKFYSDENLNTNGKDHFVSYQGTGDKIKIDPFSAGKWMPNEFIFGVEDGNDNDYQDLVLLVESISPVPEPGTLSLLGLGLAGLGFSASRRRKTA